jgi:hypothetical protein
MINRAYVSPLGFSIEGPSQARIECNDNGDGSANVRYWPTIPGEYAVHILCNDEDIPLSPFMAWIEAPGNFDPNKVRKTSDAKRSSSSSEAFSRSKPTDLDLNQRDKLLANQPNSPSMLIMLAKLRYAYKPSIKTINQSMCKCVTMAMERTHADTRHELLFVIAFWSITVVSRYRTVLFE